jgi:hypothetical protein
VIQINKIFVLNHFKNETMTYNKNIGVLIKGIMAFMLLCLLGSTSLFGQDLLWKANFTGAGHNVPFKSVIDLNDNIYVIGTFRTSCTSSVPPLTKTGTDDDIFVAKYNSSGVLLWARQLGSTGTDFASGLDVSSDGQHIYITGYFQNTLSASGRSIVSSGGYDGFLAKYQSNGDIVWLKSIGTGSGSSAQRPNDITFDKNSNLVLGGIFSTGITLKGLRDTTFLTTRQVGMFVAQFDTSGSVIKACKFESDSSASRLYTLDVDTSGYYLAGRYVKSLITDLPQQTNTSLDMYVYKVNYNLQGQWLIKVYGNGDESISSCSTDGNGNFYFGGEFSSPSILIDSTAGGITSLRIPVNKTSDGKSDIFFAKYRYDGTLQWFNTVGSTENDRLFRALYKNGNFIAAGQYGNTLTFNNKTINHLGNGDAFAIVQNQNDNLVYLMPFTGTGAEVGETAVVDNNGNFVVIGDYTSSRVYIAGQDSLDNSNSGTKDMFVAKFDKGSLNHVITPITCYGSSTGAISITPEGTVIAPYTYSWTKVGDPSFTRSTEDISGLNAGFYRVSFTDALGYNKVDTITLVDPPQIMVSLVSSTNVSCNGGLNGAIDISASGGTGSLSYAWTTSGGTGVNATAEDQTTLSAGIYHVSVRDINNCIAALNNIVVTQPARITFNGTVVTKINGSQGAIDLSIQGGTQPYDYNWTGPSGFTATTEDISNLVIAGNYRVDVTDANSCTNDTTMLVADAYVMNAYISAKQDVLCKGGNTGSATVAVDSAVGNVTYAWSNGGNTPTISNLVAASYSVTVTDSKIPTPQTVVVNVTIEEPLSPFTVSIARTNITCHGLNNGILDANPSGGTLPFNYSWTKEAQPYNGNNETLTGLSEGAYAVTVTDANNCLATATNTIVNPDVITFSGTVKDVTCEVGKYDGGITLSNLQGGTGAYSFLWSNGLTTQNVSLLAAGDYSVTVSDANYCQTTNNYVIDYEAPIVISLTPTDISCFGLANGIMNAAISGGHPTFKYSWSNGDTTQQVTGLLPGTYSVTVTDNKLCTKIQSGVVSEPQVLSIGSYNQLNVSCFGGNSGSVSLNVTGGTPVYSYSWDQGAGSGSTASGLPSGTYNVTITDSHNCTTNGTFTITEPAALALAEDINAHINNECFGLTNGTITLLPSGGSGEYQYSMNNGTWMDLPVFSGLAAGDYNFRMRDKNAITCIYNWSNTISISQPQGIVLNSATKTDILCNGSATGTMATSAVGGTEPYTYTLRQNGLPTGNTSGINTGSFSGIPAGSNYTIDVTDINNCLASVTGTVTINEPDPFVIDSVSVKNATLKSPTWNGSIQVYVSGGMSPYTYALGALSPQSSGLFENLQPEKYVITITDANGCTPLKTDSLEIEDYTGITPVQGPSVKIFPNPTFSIVNLGFENFNVMGSLIIELVDLSGRVVYSGVISETDLSAGSYPIDMGGYAKGVYIIRIDGKLLKEKIIYY